MYRIKLKLARYLVEEEVIEIALFIEKSLSAGTRDCTRREAMTSPLLRHLHRPCPGPSPFPAVGPREKGRLLRSHGVLDEMHAVGTSLVFFLSPANVSSMPVPWGGGGAVVRPGGVS